MIRKSVKIWACVLALPMAASLAACDTATPNEAPVIRGVRDIDCIVGESVDLLYRVAALDREDGDITPDMDIDITPSAKLSGGVAVFPAEGTYEVTYYVEDSAGESTEAYIYVTVYSRDVYRQFMDTNGFFATTAGGAEIVGEGVTDGRYGVKVDGAQKPSDATLSRIYELAPDVEYNIEYTVKANAMGTLRVFADEKELAMKQIEENAVGSFSFDYHVPAQTVAPEADNDETGEEEPDEEELAEVQIDVQFGSLGDSIEFELEKVVITPKNATGEYKEVLDGFDYRADGKVHDRFDGAEGSVIRNEDSVVLNITKAAGDAWRGGMFIDTGIPLDAGDACMISFDAKASASFEIIPQCKQWGPNEQIKTCAIESGDGKREVEFTVPDNRIGSLWIYVQSGDKINEISLSNLSVKKRSSGGVVYSFDKFEESHAESGNGTLKCENSTLIYNVSSFGSTDWHNKVQSPSFRVDGTVDKFIVSFKAKASKRVKTVFAAPKAGGWDPNLLWKQFYIEEEEKYYFFTTDNVREACDHTLLWQFGAGENQRYNNVTIEISDIRVNLRHGLLDYNGK